MDWMLGTCYSNQTYENFEEYTQKCCLNPGNHSLCCENQVSGDGWKGGFVEFQGQKYCENFSNNYIKIVNVTIVTGKYCFRKGCMCSSIKRV